MRCLFVHLALASLSFLPYGAKASSVLYTFDPAAPFLNDWTHLDSGSSDLTMIPSGGELPYFTDSIGFNEDVWLYDTSLSLATDWSVQMDVLFGSSALTDMRALTAVLMLTIDRDQSEGVLTSLRYSANTGGSLSQAENTLSIGSLTPLADSTVDGLRFDFDSASQLLTGSYRQSGDATFYTYTEFGLGLASGADGFLGDSSLTYGKAEILIGALSTEVVPLGDLALDNIQISVVPEHASVGLYIGLSLFFWASFIRRR